MVEAEPPPWQPAAAPRLAGVASETPRPSTSPSGINRLYEPLASRLAFPMMHRFILSLIEPLPGGDELSELTPTPSPFSIYATGATNPPTGCRHARGSLPLAANNNSASSGLYRNTASWIFVVVVVCWKTVSINDNRVSCAA